MADGLCGPSNALSNFQKHTAVDRTLQQDRLASQSSREQGFRSAPGLNAGVLDAEFEAFQAGQLPQFHETHAEHHFHDAFPAHDSFQSFPTSLPPLPGWASEFQNMNLGDVRSSPAPVASHYEFQPTHPNQMMRSQFEMTQQPAMGLSQEMSTAYRAPPMNFSSFPTGYWAVHGAEVDQTEHGHMTNQAQPPEVYDALFEEHFQAAARETQQIMGQAEADMQPLRGETISKAQSQEQGFDNASLLGPSIQRDQQQDPIIDASLQDPIGSDLITEESKGKGKQREAMDDADELAKTAGDLLDNMQHEQGHKFKQSTFLSLMRQLRDREVRVEGDKLVDASQPLHPGGEFYPDQQEQGGLATGEFKSQMMSTG